MDLPERIWKTATSMLRTLIEQVGKVHKDRQVTEAEHGNRKEESS